MKNKISIFVAFLIQLSSLADTATIEAIKRLNEANKNAPSPVLNTSCIHCSENPETKIDPFCENLYEASCLTPDGKHIYENE